ncbi:hypothetical protein HDU86_002990 [Geranomyces michiganensis]|nr:hypothetical protein HDU86_002990 [Geranomyces michiganensis]
MTRPASTRFELAAAPSLPPTTAHSLLAPPILPPASTTTKLLRTHYGHHGGGAGAGGAGLGGGGVLGGGSGGGGGGSGGSGGGGIGIAGGGGGGHHALPRGGGGMGGGGAGTGTGIDRENGISLQAKQAIIETSPARLSNYDPRDVADVFKCGFCSDAKDFYKPLGAKERYDPAFKTFGMSRMHADKVLPPGDPVLDSETLVLGTLRIDPNSVQSSADAKIAEENNELSEVKLSARRPLADTSPRHNNGFEHIKEKLAKSKGRMDAVKFGIPFTQTIDDSAWRHRVDAKNGKSDSQLQEGQVDWHRLKVDTDKQAYFQNVLERELPGFIAQKRRKAPKTSQQSLQERSTERWGTLVDKRPRSGRLATPVQATDKEAESRSVSNSSLASASKGLTPKAMELALNIHRDDRINLATDQYYTTREHFYEQRRRLTQVLLDDLNRLDFERKAQFVRKYRNFHIGKNNMFSEDIKAMRKRSERQRAAEKNQLLQQHPWYTELVTKVVLSGAKKHASEYEELLLSRVKCVIEDNLPFTQNTFVQLMKVLPAHEFMKDDIQRIIRFVKAHGNVTEREFLEAVELAGHMQSL